MKILHFADAHLGSDDSGPIVPETGLSTRLTDFLSSLDRIAEYVEGNEVDLVVFCGDAFKNRNPSPTLEREFARRIRRMSSYVPVVLVVGNHDLPGAFGKAHTLQIYKTLAVGDVHIVDRPILLHLATTAGSCQIVGIPWPTRHNVMINEALQGIPAEQIDTMITDVVAETIKRFAGQLDPEMPAILAGHLTIEGGDMGGGTPVGLGGGISLPLEAVALPQFDYVALGHLHRHQQLYDNPPVVYSGSIERVDFGEEKDEKGFVVVTLGQYEDDELFGDGAYTQVEFVPLKARRFVTIEVHLDGTDPTEAVMEAIHGQPIKGAIVRVIVEGTEHSAALLDEGAIHKALEPALRHNIIKQIDRAQRTRLDGATYQEMSPRELLEAWLHSNGKPPEEREALLKAAEELMREEAA